MHAFQVEESYIGAEEFCRVLKQQEAAVLRGELVLLQALRFELIVYGPHRPLQGLLQVWHLPENSSMERERKPPIGVTKFWAPLDAAYLHSAEEQPLTSHIPISLHSR